jgi:RNA polymerase sigma factor (sigma-70 family)
MTSTRADPPVVPADLKRRFEAEALPLLPGMHAAATYLTRNASDAQDLVQEAYLRAYRGFARFQPGTNLRAWLHRILMNTFINDHRKRRRLPNLVFGERGDHGSRSWRTVEADPAPSAEDRVLASLPDEALQETLAFAPCAVSDDRPARRRAGVLLQGDRRACGRTDRDGDVQAAPGQEGPVQAAGAAGEGALGVSRTRRRGQRAAAGTIDPRP